MLSKVNKWTRNAENLKLNCRFGEARARELKVNEASAYLTKAKDDVNPNLIELLSEGVPRKEKPKEDDHHVEWWDASIYPYGEWHHY